jgi:hypothetical protein
MTGYAEMFGCECNSIKAHICIDSYLAELGQLAVTKKAHTPMLVVDCRNSGSVICNCRVIYRLPIFVSLRWACHISKLFVLSKNIDLCCSKTAIFLLTFLSLHKRNEEGM